MIADCLNETFVGCRDDGYRQKRRSNEHHLYFPKFWYQSELEKAFRDLPENKVQMCVCAHDLLHELREAPEKPSVQQMCLALTVEIEAGGLYEC